MSVWDRPKQILPIAMCLGSCLALSGCLEFQIVGSTSSQATLLSNDLNLAPTSLSYTSSKWTVNYLEDAAPNTPVVAGGAPTQYSISPALPAGMSMDSTTGIISGTPSQGTYLRSYTVTASNSYGSVSTTVKIKVTGQIAWTWMGGATSSTFLGSFGTLGVAASSNIPSGRYGAAVATDASGNLWMFGGHGYDSTGTDGVSLNDLWKFDGTNWTWISGANIGNQLGVYGTQGVAASTSVPGARYYAASWVDSSGNFWLLGGNGYDINGNAGCLNDLWKFDGTNWTWISGYQAYGQLGTYGTRGVTNSSNIPGARYDATTWKDKSGNVWLLGGVGYDSTGGVDFLNDLWKFDGSNWTWISGSDLRGQSGTYGTLGVANSSNIPGGRSGSAVWQDGAGNVWLFGGYGRDSVGAGDHLNDLWKYDGTNWTWVAGSNLVSQPGTYGTLGVANSSNIPGARYDSAAWQDGAGNVWLFGGDGCDSVGDCNKLNDLWKFDGANWTWVGGSNVYNQSGTYGAQGTGSASNIPGARGESMVWKDKAGKVHLFGGNGYDAAGNVADLEDLWIFDGTNWIWSAGPQSASPIGNFGQLGVASASSWPGGRETTVISKDPSGNVWMFGGWGYGGGAQAPGRTGGEGNLNDLWKFDGTNWTWAGGTPNPNDPGVQGSLGVSSPSNLPMGVEYPIFWSDGKGNFWIYGGWGNETTAPYSYIEPNELWKFDGTNWTWLNGSTALSPGVAPVFGIQGVGDPANTPGFLGEGAATWVDQSGNLWLFGGWTDSNRSSALWEFDGTNWIWVGGPQAVNQGGTYGIQGLADPANFPGARADSISWMDAHGNFWMFGGDGYDSVGAAGNLNDLWKFDGTNWTWVSGSNLVNQAESYGTLGVADPSNAPGARSGMVGWSDATGNIWIFGGQDTTGNEISDLWKFDGSNWTWMSGPNTGNQAAVFGALGVSSSSNQPPARWEPNFWKDDDGDIWLFGGYGTALDTADNDRNDLWILSF